MVEDLLSGIALLLSWQVVLAAAIGIALGIVIGAIPGLGPTIAIAVLIPVTFAIPPVPSMMLLLGVYQGGIYGGSISAILYNIPGTAAASATVFDGFPLARAGLARRALKAALYASVVGNGLSCLVLLFVAAPLASLALRFGPPEIAALMLFALTVIGAVSGRSILKGLLVTFLGLLFSTIGLDPIWGTARLSFGVRTLDSGLALIPVLIGLFAVSELLIQVGRADPARAMTAAAGTTAARAAEDGFSWLELWRMRLLVLYSSAIGLFVGALPGIGSTTPAFICYGIARQRSKEPDRFGEGAIEGVVAPETANNAVTGGALIPLLSLGIPGDATTAVILGALMLQGLAPGPFLFQNHGPEVYAILTGVILQTLPTVAIGLLMLPFAVRLLHVPRTIIFPSVLVMCVVGAFTVNYTLFDVGVMIAAGFIGFACRLYGFPLPPLLIGFILGAPFERAVRQSLLMSQGSAWIFFTRPIALALLVLAVVTVLVSIRLARRLPVDG
jgi:putative tricarboxylic transport membrane protein